LSSINNTTTAQDKVTLQTLLDGIAPYLSSDAFDLLVAHPLISWQERVDILLDNQALIKKYREEIPTQYQGLLEYTTLDGRQLLEEQIFLNQRAQMELIALGLYHVENNTERDFWLSKMPVEFTSYISFKEKWSEWDFNAMDMILADLTLEEELHPMLLQDVQEFQPILDQLELWKTNNVNLYQLDSIQVDSLVALSDELTLYVSAPYAAFMKFFYGVDIQSNVLPQNRSADNQSWSTYVSNKAESKIRLAPNPGSECFRLINAEGTHKLALYDISGKLVLRGNVGEGEAFCPGASIDAGLYFIQYHNNHHTGTLKWIKE
ncbi:MAG TPA: T9SS type A sorting domain-containing protein, partial [Saprospiraceae bacterium]|nr:T9SS type A sorting domain-containing protein [Saprospiraceae bacterium]